MGLIFKIIGVWLFAIIIILLLLLPILKSGKVGDEINELAEEFKDNL